MATTPLNDNIRIEAAKPIDDRQYSTQSLLPHNNKDSMNAAIDPSVRYPGLFGYVSSSSEQLTKYWYYGGTSDEHLVAENANDLGKEEKSTGFVTGLEININLSDSASFDIDAGYFIVTTYDDLTKPLVELKYYEGSSANVPNYLITSNATYVALDSDGIIIQSPSPFDNSDRRAICLIGILNHPNRTFIESVSETKAPLLASTNQIHDIIEAVGPLNITGNVYNYSGSVGMRMTKTAGKIFGLGINAIDYSDPHSITLTSQNNLLWRYRLQDGTEFSDTDEIDSNNYDDNGSLTAVPSGKFTIQRINLFQNNTTRVQYGQAVYDTMNDARLLLQTEPFIKESNIAEDAIFRSYIILKEGIVDLSSSIAADSASFIPVDKFGNLLGNAGVSITYNTLVDALGYVPENESLKVQTLSGSNNNTYPSTAAVSNSIENGLNITSNGKIRLGGTLLENTNILTQNNISLNLTAISSSYINMQWDRSGDDLLDYSYSRVFVNQLGISLQSLKYFYYSRQFHGIYVNTGSIFLEATQNLNLRLSSLPDASPNDYILFQESGSDDITGLQVRKASTIPASYISGLNYITTSSFNTFTSSLNIPQHRIVLGNNSLITSSGNIYYSSSLLMVATSSFALNMSPSFRTGSYSFGVSGSSHFNSVRFLVGRDFISGGFWEPGSMFGQWRMFVSTGSVGAAYFEARLDVGSYPVNHTPSIVISTGNFYKIMTIAVAGINGANGPLTKVGDGVIATRGDASLNLNNILYLSGSSKNAIVGGNTDRGQKLQVEGTVRIAALSGSGFRMVIADATGSLMTQEIPTNSTSSLTINNNGAFRLLTSNGSTSSLDAQSSLIFSESLFTVYGSVRISTLESKSIGLLRTSESGEIYSDIIDTGSSTDFIMLYNSESNDINRTTFNLDFINSKNILSISSNITASNNTIYLVDTSGGSKIVWLNTSTIFNAGRTSEIIINKSTNDFNSIEVYPTTGTINGNTHISITEFNESKNFVSNGSNIYII